MKLRERYNFDNLGNRSQEMVFESIAGSSRAGARCAPARNASWTSRHGR